MRPGRLPPPLLIIFLAAFGLRLGFAVAGSADSERILTADSELYVDLAESLLSRFEFVRSHGWSVESPADGEFFRTPGYPLFIAAVISPCALLPSICGQAFNPLPYVGALMGSFSALLAYLVVLCLFGDKKLAFWTAILCALDMSQSIYSVMIMSDGLFVFLLLAALAMALRRPDSMAAMIFCGLIFSAACSVRPVGAFAVFPLAGFLLFRKASLRHVTVLVVVAMLFPCLWSWRNYARFGVFSPSSAFAYNLYVYSAAKVQARVNGTAAEAEVQKLYIESTRKISDMTLQNKSAWLWQDVVRNQGLTIISDHPKEASIEALVSLGEMFLAGERRNVLKLLGSPRGSDSFPSAGQGRRSSGGVLAFFSEAPLGETLLVAAQVLLNGLVVVFFVAGSILLFRRGLKAESIFIACNVAYFALSSLVVASARMRMPFSVFLYAVAVWFLMNVRAWFSSLSPCLGHGPGPRSEFKIDQAGL